MATKTKINSKKPKKPIAINNTMKLVERHVIKHSNPNWKTVDTMSFWSKNLYNAGLWEIKQHFIATGKYLGYNQLDKIMQKNENYHLLPASTSQQALIILDKNYKSFFNSKGKVSNRKTPKYKNKKLGRNIVAFSNTQCKIKDGKLVFPKKTNLLPVTTKVDKPQQVRITPQANCYILEVVYDKLIENKKLNKKNVLAIDIGVNNLCTMVTNKVDSKPIILNGRPIKSINQFYNKKKAKLQSIARKENGKKTTKRIDRLTMKRKFRLDNYLHHASKAVIDYCLNNDIGSVVVGKNDGWKTGVNIGKKNNQTFVQLPFEQLLGKIQYKAKLKGIAYSEICESYTSKCSALDFEAISKHEQYVGSRIKRGLFKTAAGEIVNADVNAALNILRKVIGDNRFKRLVKTNRGCGYHPVKINLCNRSQSSQMFADSQLGVSGE